MLQILCKINISAIGNLYLYYPIPYNCLPQSTSSFTFCSYKSLSFLFLDHFTILLPVSSSTSHLCSIFFFIFLVLDFRNSYIFAVPLLLIIFLFLILVRPWTTSLRFLLLSSFLMPWSVFFYTTIYLIRTSFSSSPFLYIPSSLCFLSFLDLEGIYIHLFYVIPASRNLHLSWRKIRQKAIFLWRRPWVAVSQ